MDIRKLAEQLHLAHSTAIDSAEPPPPFGDLSQVERDAWLAVAALAIDQVNAFLATQGE